MSGKKSKANRNLKKKSIPKKLNSIKRTGIIIVTIIIIAIIGLFAYNLTNKETNHRKTNLTPSTYKNTSASCIKSPIFPIKHGLKQPFAIDLRQGSEFRGMRIIEPKKNGKIIQLSSWDDFGYLGLYTLDDKGNIYTASMPYVSIDINPPKDQNKILIVDSRTGEMSIFMDLPSVVISNAKNPFGVIGLGFDCDTKSLYVTSVAGSTYKNEIGKIYQIDPSTKEIISTNNNLDVMGLSLFQGKLGKRLYLGLARKPEVYSIGLNEKGEFMNDLRFEFSLKDIPGGSTVKAHRIRIKDNIMTIKAREFNFTLIAASVSMRTIFTFKYNNSLDKWEFVELHSENPNAHLNNHL